MATVAIIDYGSGNLRSAAKALERVARERGAGDRVVVTSDADAVARADRVVLPGVGAFRDCRDGLMAVDGMADALGETVRGRGRPFLGICVGMQLMAREGLEHGVTRGLGWIDGVVAGIAPSDPALKVPHMGWNRLRTVRPHPLLAGLGPDPFVYFVHSYGFRVADPATLLAETDHGGPIAAVLGLGNVAGTQFHPEKSQAAGLALLGNFLAWTP